MRELPPRHRYAIGVTFEIEGKPFALLYEPDAPIWSSTEARAWARTEQARYPDGVVTLLNGYEA